MELRPLRRKEWGTVVVLEIKRLGDGTELRTRLPCSSIEPGPSDSQEYLNHEGRSVSRPVKEEGVSFAT